VNGVIDGTDLVYRDYYDISIAVATPKGLVVPVLRNVEDLDFAGVERVRSPILLGAMLLRTPACLCLPRVISTRSVPLRAMLHRVGSIMLDCQTSFECYHGSAPKLCDA